MRAKSILLFAAIILLSVPALPFAAAEETWGCHSYEVYQGDRETGAGVSTDDGAIGIAAGGVYVVSDTLPFLGPDLFSIWVFTENNGQPGLQRADDFCHDAEPGEQDCFISCTF